MKIQQTFSHLELLLSILDPVVVQKLLNVNKQQNTNVNKINMFTVFEGESRIFSFSAQTLSKEAKMGEIHREMPKLANCGM